jgi:hypothetical protein
MKVNLSFTTVIFVLFFSPLKNTAQDSTAKTVFGGFVDAYYAYSLNEPVDKNVPYAYNHGRHNEMNVNLALLTAKYTSLNVRGNLGLMAGTYPMANYSAEPLMFQHIYDANVGFKLSKNWWVDAGIFGSSHIGLEGAVSKDNWTLTRSLCAENTPYYATAAELNYEPHSNFLFSLIVSNGWQNIRDNNSNKSLGYQITYKPTSKVTINASSFVGEGRNAPDSLREMRYFHHAYSTLQLTKKLALVAMVDVGAEERSYTNKELQYWFNPTVLIRYAATPKFAVCLRGEHYNDPNGVIIPTGTANNFITTGTSINVDYTPYTNVWIRLEGKTFFSKDQIYSYGTSGVSSGETLFTTSIAVSF